MKAIEIARKLAQLEEQESALKAYTLAIHENNGQDPALDMEAALYILEHEGDYKISYTCFRDLYNRGAFREDILSILDQAFYAPNEREQRTCYERNLAALGKYPYLFRKDFPSFEDLPIRFYPYDDNGYLPLCRDGERFGEYINFKKPVVSRNFFKNLENPILADDVYSQYELEYLNDNVRCSEYIGRENHVYLHYTDWKEFCAYLQCLDLRPMLRDEKIVFLIEDEISQYPIDFKERFGLDYSQYPLKPLGIREIHRLIWHTQLSSHNGGDFFNEVLDGHPNLLFYSSLILSDIEDILKETKTILTHSASERELREGFRHWKSRRVVEELIHLRDITDKDILVASFLNSMVYQGIPVESDSRIAPALLFQPHFHNLRYDIRVEEESGRAILFSEQYEAIRRSPVFRCFKYIKTFTPIRRTTTSHGATVRFMVERKDEGKEGKIGVIEDNILHVILNRSFMVDPQDRLFRDSAMVRFEDGKLNPKATFTALAAFLDIPYTQSMTYCSLFGKIDPVQIAGNARGFDPVTVYRTYDGYINDAERYFLEYLMRDLYAYCGYDFQYYDGRPVSEEALKRLMEGFTVMDGYMRDTWRKVFESGPNAVESNGTIVHGETSEEVRMADLEIDPAKALEHFMEQVHRQRWVSAAALLKGLRFVNLQGQPLRMMPKLRLDPALLERPLYH